MGKKTQWRAVIIMAVFSVIFLASRAYQDWKWKRELAQFTAEVEASPPKPYKNPCAKGYYMGSVKWPNETTCHKAR